MHIKNFISLVKLSKAHLAKESLVSIWKVQIQNLGSYSKGSYSLIGSAWEVAE